ncbi:hypothetical protein RFI_21770 [Reticulomyxa filosa]|uniref:Beta-lactamase-related domain-containing protein n=1 Tax=Reticulomyxa filosa TaxID=46433 RepID=X6MPI6_RETFI|nr:hypothetical protein RFI_21770 [Reticulomyxa filosa]|eukprot:ETO15591.1 hypothetical protein RFI_21770 [Reticulomyxa filosa]
MSEWLGVSYEENLQSLVIKPLELENTGLYLNAQQQAHASVGYDQFAGVSYPYVDLGWASPAGQIFSSVKDLSILIGQYFSAYSGKYGFNLNPNSLQFAPQTLREMLRPVYLNPDLQSGISFLQCPGFSTDIALVPELKLGVIALTNGGIDGSSLTWSQNISINTQTIGGAQWLMVDTGSIFAGLLYQSTVGSSDIFAGMLLEQYVQSCWGISTLSNDGGHVVFYKNSKGVATSIEFPDNYPGIAFTKITESPATSKDKSTFFKKKVQASKPLHLNLHQANNLF